MSSTLYAIGCTLFLGLGLVLAQIGMRDMTPLRAAAVSIPTTLAMYLVMAPFLFNPADWSTRSAIIFALLGCLFPVAVTMLNFAANRKLGANVTGALGNATRCSR